MKNKNQNWEKRILIAEVVLVVGILVYLFFSSAPNQVYPLSGMTITDPDFVFEIENGEQVLVSVDKGFTNPIVLEEGSDIILPPGIYYWKVKSKFRESEVKTFTIQSHAGLNLKDRDENHELENSGNVDLDVAKKRGGITTNIEIDAGDSTQVEKDDSNYKARQI